MSRLIGSNVSNSNFFTNSCQFLEKNGFQLIRLHVGSNELIANFAGNRCLTTTLDISFSPKMVSQGDYSDVYGGSSS